MNSCFEEPTLAEVRPDPVTSAVMDAHGVEPRDLTGKLSQITRRLPHSSAKSFGRQNAAVSSTSDKVVSTNRKPNVGIEPFA